MPYDLDYLEFVKAHGRPPRADELDLDQRFALLECLLEELRGFGERTILRAAYERYAEDPIAFRDFLNDFSRKDSETARRLRKLIYSQGHDALFASLRQYLDLDRCCPARLKHFVELMHAVGIEVAE